MNLDEALHAYQSFAPERWARVFTQLPLWMGFLGMALGLLLLLSAGGRGFRLLAGPLAAAAGLLWLGPVARGLELGATSVRALTVGGAFVMATVSFAFPQVAVFVLFGLPAGLAAGELVPRGEWLIGFAAAFLLMGTLAMFFQRALASVASSLAGAWLWVLGLLTVFNATAAAKNLERHPGAIFGAALLFAVAGVIYQLGARPSPEEAGAEHRERLRRKREKKEKRALEARWRNYSKKTGR